MMQTIPPMPTAMRRASDILIWPAAGLPMLMALLLLATLVSLSAAQADEIRCGGRDLMADLGQRDPAALAKITAAETAALNGNAIFWRIDRPGLRPSFLLGTMHLSDPRVLSLPAPAETARRSADLLVIESDEILDERKVAAVMLAHPEVTMLPDGQTVDSLLSPEESQRLHQTLESRGLSASLLSRMQPWLIMSVVATPACEAQRKAAGALFLDQKLAMEAKAMGKPVKGLETLLEQAQSMASVAPRLQLQALMETLETGDRLPDMSETMVELYQAQRIAAIVPMLEAITSEGNKGASAASATSATSAASAAFDEKIVKLRNQRMAERLLPMLDSGNVFAAVGALHLPGKDGLVERLRAAGFTLTAER